MRDCINIVVLNFFTTTSADLCILWCYNNSEKDQCLTTIFLHFIQKQHQNELCGLIANVSFAFRIILKDIQYTQQYHAEIIKCKS